MGCTLCGNVMPTLTLLFLFRGYTCARRVCSWRGLHLVAGTRICSCLLKTCTGKHITDDGIQEYDESKKKM
ncbi:hypothetical protein V8C42DRAFT_94246 [Trichoderma barbatum]